MNKKAEIGGAGIALIIIGILFLVCVFWVIGGYNGLVNSDESVKNSWSKVETAYQRRIDLIPNLISTVETYAKYEKGTLTEITELRSQVGQAQTMMADAETPEDIQAADQIAQSTLSRLLVVVENYPDLKASENFLSLQDELAGTENRVKFERDNYNDAVKSYRVNVRRFPTNILAGIFGFGADRYDLFDAVAGAEIAPKVQMEI